MRTPSLPTARGLAVLFAAAFLFPSVAHAGKSSVRITTTPRGAVVSTDSGAVLGSTPLRTKMELGTHILTITKDGYEPLEYAIEVQRRRRKNRFRVALDRINAIDVILSDDSISGAAIYIDGEKRATAPSMIKLDKGAYQIQIKKEGYVTYEEYVELDGLHEIEAALEPLTIDGPPKKKKIAPEVDDDEWTGDALPMVHVGGGLELGGRRFRYTNPQTVLMRNFDAGGVPMVRLNADVFPLASMHHKLLSGISLSGTFSRGAPVNSNTSDGQVVGTGFGDMELGVGWRVPVGRPTLAGNGGDVALQVAYGRQFFSFDQMNPLAAEVPEVDYKFVRVGAGFGSTFSERYRAHGVASYRMVKSSGLLGERFEADNTSGIGIDAGLSMRLRDSFELRVEANLVRYGHTFQFEDGAEFQAAGASDSFFGVLFGALYVY